MDSCVLSLEVESEIKSNSEVIYTCTRDLKYVQGYGMLFVYGIKCYINPDDLDNPYNCCIIEDISNNKEFVLNLLTKLENNKVLPIHIKDIVIDAIS
jgi:hypothetical protein